MDVQFIDIKAPERDVSVETCAGLNSCPGSISHWGLNGQLLDLSASVFS